MTISKRLLRECSPHYRPLRWLILNSIILTWSTGILIYYFIFTDGPREEETAQIDYLVYNFITCTVWVLEVIFHTLDFFRFLDDDDEGREGLLEEEQVHAKGCCWLALWIEVVLAIIFFFDAINGAIHLERQDVDKYTADMVYWIILDIVAYSYMVCRSYNDWRIDTKTSSQPHWEIKEQMNIGAGRTGKENSNYSTEKNREQVDAGRIGNTDYSTEMV